MRHDSIIRTPLLALALTLGLAACEEKVTPDVPLPAAAKAPVKLGLLPAVDAAAVEKAYAPLAAELSKALGRPVVVVVPSRYGDLITKLREGELNLAQLSAAAFVRLRGVLSGQVLVQQRADYANAYRGAFVVKKGQFPGLKALKGKRVAYVNRHSSAGYWFPRMKLRQNNFDPDAIFSKTIFAGSHEKVIEAVRGGEVDAGVVSEQSLAGADDLEVIEVTNPIPDDVLVAVSGLSQQEQEDVRALLLDAASNPALTAYMKEHKIREYRRHNFDEYALLEMELRLSNALIDAAPVAEEPE